MIYDPLPLYIIHHLHERLWVLTICFQYLLFDIAPACPEGQLVKTFCSADECKAFTCIDPHKVKVCVKHGLGKMDGEEESDSNMLRIPSHFLPDSLELCLPSIVA